MRCGLSIFYHDSITEIPTLFPTQIPTKEGAVEEPTANPGGSESDNVNAGVESPADEVLLDLTTVLLIVFGVLICGTLCLVLYYWYNRKQAVKRAKALQFRFNANRAMELNRVKSDEYSDKRTS